MCGIAGAIWNDEAEPITRTVLERMTTAVAHRGPDGSGFFNDSSTGGGVALGHRRLAIIDIDGGRQPLSNEDGTVWITFNGEIYNYKELRGQLAARGHAFRTDSDTEVIVHLYEEKGFGCLEDLCGMFAFAIWDARKQLLFMARDRIGQKPLVYSVQDNRCIFASEMKSILQAPDISREIDPVALNEYLAYLYIPHPRTIFKRIRKLPPAHYAVFQRGELSVRRYWNPDFDQIAAASFEELQDQLRDVLLESVRLRMRSDVPLGAFLSGGVDSAVIVGLMQQLSSKKVQTYTIGFPIEEYDETDYARMTANHLRTDHRQLQVRPRSFDILPQLIWHYDEPYGDSSAIPTYYVSQLTREHVKVALTGDGGDELFGGYPRYETVRQFGRFDAAPWLRGLAKHVPWSRLPVPDRERSMIRRLCQRGALLAEAPSRRYASWVTHYHPDRRKMLYSDDFLAELGQDGADEFFVAAIDRCRSACAGTRAMAADIQSYLPCDLLTKVDVASMAHGLECRSPFLDHRVVELAISIPYKFKISGGKTKRILKQTFRNLIPAPVASGAKRGFSIPLDNWFRKEHRAMACDVLLDSSALNRGFFRREAVQRIVDEHVSGRWNHGERIWALLCLELWHRMFIDDQAVTPPPLPAHEPGPSELLDLAHVDRSMNTPAAR